MDIAFHIGANCTDEDRLLRSVTKNLPNLAGRGTRVPNPARYRRLLRETIQHLRGGSPEPDTRDVLMHFNTHCRSFGLQPVAHDVVKRID